MKRIMVFICAGLLIFSQGVLFSQSTDSRPLIQLALLLDTSNSMDGLINQAKSQLWKIVSETGRLSRGGIKPVLQVALYEYGNDNLSARSGYIRQVCSFTTDLDLISCSLFSLSTCGGSEFCGNVINDAVWKMDWDRNPGTLKLIFIAGNEPFSQGPVSYSSACGSASRKEIIVNTIFCGDYREGVMTQWQHGADLTGGRYMNIDSDYEQVYIQAPQDERISQLNMSLNGTYLGYGASGGQKKAMQEEQDVNAAAASPEALMDRARVKSTASYSNSSWDLVDAYIAGEVALSAVSESDLPEEMRDMTDREKEEYLQALVTERAAIQAEILRLSIEREAYIARQRELNAAQSSVSTLDTAVIEAIRAEAQAKGFDLE